MKCCGVVSLIELQGSFDDPVGDLRLEQPPLGWFISTSSAQKVRWIKRRERGTCRW